MKDKLTKPCDKPVLARLRPRVLGLCLFLTTTTVQGSDKPQESIAQASSPGQSLTTQSSQAQPLQTPSMPKQETLGTWGKWSKVCIHGTECLIVQTASESETGSVILQTVVKYVPEDPKPVLFLTAPLGIYLPKGIALFVDDDDQGKLITIQRCDKSGCLGLISLEDDWVLKMKKGVVAKAILAVTNEKNIQIPVSLEGFTAALKSLTEP